MTDPRRGEGGRKAAPAQVSDASQDQANPTPALLGAAVAYPERDWPVLPLWWPVDGHCACPRGAECPSPAKHPLTAHGLKDATTDPAVIRGRWRRWPSANIGLATGFAFDVLDVDGDEGRIALDDVANLGIARPDEPLDGPTAATGGGGWHCLVQPTGMGNRAKFIVGCDWRGEGGYIVASPSVHVSGRPYRWLDGCAPDDVAILVATGWLLALLSPPAALTRPPGATGRPVGTVAPPGDRKAAYGRRALESEALAVALAVEGTRNHTLNTAALKLGQVVAGGYLDAAEVVATLLAAAERAGLERREAEATIASGMAAGMAQPRRLAS